MRRNTSRVITGDTPVNWLGANFWSRTGGPLMWRSYDPSVDRARSSPCSARHGLTMTRSFFYWPDFMPGAVRDRRGRCGALRRLPRRAQRAGPADHPHLHRRPHVRRELGPRLARRPGPVRGRVDGRPPGLVRRGDGAPLRGPPGRRRLAGLQRDAAVRRLRAPTTRSSTAWARIIVDAVRAAGGHQPFSLGDGAWGIEVTGHDNGFSLAEIAAARRLPRAAHLPGRRRPGRGSTTPPPFACELSGALRPAGRSWRSSASAPTSPPTPTPPCYYRQVLHTTLLAGATGWIAWNNTDFALPHQDPYRHHAFELHFGLTDAHGTPKAHAHRDEGLRADARRHRLRELRARGHRHRARRVQLPGQPVPLHLAGQPRRGRQVAAPGVHLRPARRPAAAADPRDDRHRAGTRGCTSSRPPSRSSPRPPRRSRSWRTTARRSTCPTAPATCPGTAARPTGR